MDQYSYITFKSVSYAMKFETALKDSDVKIKIIPVPRSISSSCGLCVRFETKDMEIIKKAMAQRELEYDMLYEMLPA